MTTTTQGTLFAMPDAQAVTLDSLYARLAYVLGGCARTVDQEYDRASDRYVYTALTDAPDARAAADEAQAVSNEIQAMEATR